MTAAPVMRVLVTGGAGQLGRALVRHAPRSVELHVTQRRTPAQSPQAHTVELADAEAVDRLVRRVAPDIVVHTAYANTERDIVDATRNMAKAVQAHGGALVHVSSDVVFDGEHAPYREDDRLCPVTEYGRWKAAAEEVVADALPHAPIVRTSLIVNPTPLDRTSAGIARMLRSGQRPGLFVDELRCPIAADDLARQIWELTSLPEADRAGAWHLVGPEALSRYALGLLVAVHEGLDVAAVHAARQAEHPKPRPRDLRLATTRADKALRIRPEPVSAVFALRR